MPRVLNVALDIDMNFQAEKSFYKHGLIFVGMNIEERRQILS